MCTTPPGRENRVDFCTSFESFSASSPRNVFCLRNKWTRTMVLAPSIWRHLGWRHLGWRLEVGWRLSTCHRKSLEPCAAEEENALFNQSQDSKRVPSQRMRQSASSLFISGGVPPLIPAPSRAGKLRLNLMFVWVTRAVIMGEGVPPPLFPEPFQHAEPGSASAQYSSLRVTIGTARPRAERPA